VQQLTIELGARSYPISIGRGLLSQGGLFERHLRARPVLIVTNQTVAPLYLQALRAGLEGFTISVLRLPDGERFKTLDTVCTVFDALVQAGINRDGAIIALGGGVVGDIAGFAAACYQRGIAFAQAPTTLLAQVDSSVGGKTGVNHPGGKNLIGAFHQPACVVSDTATLDTLPERELRAGMAEIIKYGLICDADFFCWLERSMEQLLAREPGALEHAIERSCRIKAGIVAADEREQGQRAVLNLGHTFGHAIEAATGYSDWLHGEAVGMGLQMAAALSVRLGRLQNSDLERVRDLLRRAGLPSQAPAIGQARAAGLMALDKKVAAGRIRLVLLDGIGAARITPEYDPAALGATLREYFGE
jgi:3-dehydroquinate synthase